MKKRRPRAATTGRSSITAINYLRPGDTLMVTKLDRLARSIPDLGKYIERIEAQGATVRVLNLELDTATATGRLMMTVIGKEASLNSSVR